MKSQDLASYINNQICHFYPDGHNCKNEIRTNIDEALDRSLFSLKHVKLKGYDKFNYLHSDIYAQFVYFLSNTIWKNSGNIIACTKLFYLNKTLHGINCTYDTKLPDIFLLIHSVGTVLGKANYSNYFVACQNVTIGSDKGVQPILNEGIYMGPGSMIIGNCNVGFFSHFSINSVLLNRNTNNNSLIIGSGSNVIEKKINRNLLVENYFNINI